MGRRKKSGGGGGANWMDTYGDMVTLLLCFFVLLYSMSDVNKEKYEILVNISRLMVKLYDSVYVNFVSAIIAHTCIIN